jgi:DegV family protein with EDD domain
MGTRVALITDSSACLPPHLCDSYSIRIVPQGLVVGDSIIPDGSVTSWEMFERIGSNRTLPHTASPAPGEFLCAMRDARAEGAPSVLCLTLSAGYSGTYAAALAAGEQMREETQGMEVRVVDTGGLAMAHGFAVLAAARALDAGADMEAAATSAVRVGARARLIGALESLDYAVKGGRVPRVVGWAASALQIKPVLSFDGERPRTISRPRTMQNATGRMLDYMGCFGGNGNNLHVAVMHSAATDAAEGLAAQVKERFSPAELLVTQFTNVMAVHTGPGFLGLAYYTDDD